MINNIPAADLGGSPDAYTLATILAARTEANAIIYIGGETKPHTRALPAIREIKIDLSQIMDHGVPSPRDGIWIGTELESGQSLHVEETEFNRSIVVCANVLERFRDPSSILTFISNVAPRARAIIITTPDRDVVRGLDHGSQKDPSRVHAWNSAEFERLLHARHLHPTFLGLTGGNILNPVRDTILAVLDRYSVEAAPPVPDDFHPLAIIATYNDRDFVLQVVGDLLEDGIDVHVLDNWSTDDTFEQLRGLASSSGGLKLERFPATGPTRYFEWHAILERKEEIAAQFPNRWVMHQDSDELRRSPWPDISMRAGLHIAERMGFNAIDFTVCDFRPIDDSFTAGMKPETAFRFFEFGRRPGQFLQVKAWRQGTERIELATSGGHQAEFPGRRIFPYNFLLKHYQFRSPTHARQKVLERRTRFSPHERANGWHTHYDNFTNNHPFLWRPSELIEFDEKETRRRFLTKLIAGIDIAR